MTSSELSYLIIYNFESNQYGHMFYYIILLFTK